MVCGGFEYFKPEMSFGEIGFEGNGLAERLFGPADFSLGHKSQRQIRKVFGVSVIQLGGYLECLGRFGESLLRKQRPP